MKDYENNKDYKAAVALFRKYDDINSYPVFPDFEDFGGTEIEEDDNFGSLVSTLQVNSIISRKNRYRLGDSDVIVEIPPLQNGGGIEGMKQFGQSSIKIAEQIRKAIPQMKDARYVKFFTHYVEDYDKNGISMPMYGKVVEDGKVIL